MDPYSFEFEKRAVAAIQRRDGVVTASDVSADTGLPLEQTTLALRRMLSLYQSHLDVDQEGILRYRFLLPMSRRGEKVQHFLAKVKDGSIKAVRWIFEVWTAVMLVAYTIIFIVLLLAIMLGLFRGRDSDDSSSDSGFGGGFGTYYLISRIIDYLFWIRLFDNRPSYSLDNAYYDKRNRAHSTEMPFYRRVNQFVWGPRTKRLDENAKQLSFAQFVRAHSGVVSAADWAAQTGQSLEEADSALTAGIVRFAGDVIVTPDGTLLYTFDRLKETASSKQQYSPSFPPIWNSPVPKPAFTGNSSGTNFGVIAMGIFIFLMSLFSLYSLPNIPFTSEQVRLFFSSDFSQIFFGWVPLTYSITLFAIPLLRLLTYSKKVHNASAEAKRRDAMKTIWASTDSGTAKPIDLSSYNSKLLRQQYKGSLDYEAGPSIYRFNNIANQTFAARTARSASQREILFGRSVYSSDEEQYSMAQDEFDDFDERLSADLGASIDIQQQAPQYVNSSNII